VELNRRTGNRHSLGGIWDSLGYAHLHLGHHAQAAACYRRAVEILDELGYAHQMAVTLISAGDAYEAAGDAGAARDAWHRALAVLDALRHPDAEQVRAKLDGLAAVSGPDRRGVEASQNA
jgi:tetratricopeptide (TPR) repeat protein